VSVPGLDLKQAIGSVPPALVDGIKDLAPSGLIKATAQIDGPVDADPSKLIRRASITLDNVQVSTSGQNPSVVGRLNLADGKLVSEDLEMRLGDNRARIDLNASNIFGKIIVVKADVTSEQFQLDPLLIAGGAAGASANQEASTKGGEELGPFDLPVKASGRVSIGKTLYKGLSIDNFIARYTLRDNILTISQLDGNIAGGAFSNKARVDLGTKGLAYSAEIDIKTIQADPLITAFIPKAAGALLGAMNLDLSIKGRGTQWDTLSKKLSGQGNMLVSDGRLISPDLVKGFASFLQLANTDEIRFQNFQGDVKIVNGKAQINSSLISDEIKLFPKGTVGLDGNLNMSMDTRLSPQLTGRLDSRGNVSSYLTDDDGWSQIPLLLTGNYAAPRFGLDPKGVQKQATRALEKELGRQLDKLFGVPKEQDQGQEQNQPAEEPAGNLLQESLKGLFGN
jgi:AsmA protein